MDEKSMVRRAWAKLGLTQTQLAAKLGVVSTATSRWETSDAVPAEPTFRLLTTLVEALEKDKRS
jgi:ribosome-binding protein aMBF1 (putative translation factor)